MSSAAAPAGSQEQCSIGYPCSGKGTPRPIFVRHSAIAPAISSFFVQTCRSASSLSVVFLHAPPIGFVRAAR